MNNKSIYVGIQKTAPLVLKNVWFSDQCWKYLKEVQDISKYPNVSSGIFYDHWVFNYSTAEEEAKIKSLLLELFGDCLNYTSKPDDMHDDK